MTWPAAATSSSIRGAALRGALRAVGRRAWLVTHSAAMSACLAIGLLFISGGRMVQLYVPAERLEVSEDGWTACKVFL